MLINHVKVSITDISDIYSKGPPPRRHLPTPPENECRERSHGRRDLRQREIAREMHKPCAVAPTVVRIESSRWSPGNAPSNSRNSVVAASLGNLPGSTNEKDCYCGGGII